MLAIEVRLNGELKGTFGAEGLEQLVAMVSARRKGEAVEYQHSVECMGVRALSPESEEVLRWANAQIALGDEVSFKLVKTTEALEPFDRQRIPRDGRNGGS